MQRRKRGEEGGVTTLTLELAFAAALPGSPLAISRGVARKNLLPLLDLVSGRDAPEFKSWRLLLPAEVARKLGMSESSSHAVLSGWRSGAVVGGSTRDGEG